MKCFLLIILLLSLVLSLLLSGCNKPPDAGHVGPVGPVGPHPEKGTPSPNLTVIEDTGVLLTKNYSFSGFTRLEISDGFDVIINQGSEYSVSARFEETAIPYMQISQNEDKLIIMLEPERTYNMVNITLDVNITMPELEEIVLKDGADATVNGLSGFKAEVDFLSNLNQ